MEARLTRVALLLQKDIKKSMGSGPKGNNADKVKASGMGKGVRSFQPSAPWTPPNIQTAFLKNNINWDKPGQLVRRVGTGVGNAKTVGYGMFLEFGTRYMLPRPWLRPAVHRIKPVMARELGRPIKFGQNF